MHNTTLRPTPKPITVTGRGAFSCLGIGAKEHWDALLRGRSVIDKGIGQVPDHWMNSESLPKFIPDSLKEYFCQSRAAHFAVRALDEAFNEARLKVGDDTVLFVATTTGQMPYWDQAMIQYLHHQIDRENFLKRFRHHSLSQFSQDVGSVFGFSKQKTFVVSSACSAATQALGLATAMLQAGSYRHAVVLGVEVLCDLTIEGFRSLQLLSNDPCLPFDENRKGINLSEGAFALVLSAQDQISTKPLAKISGYGWTTDSYHMTGPHPEGDGSFRAMKGAIESSGRNLSDIDYIYAHGTGSAGNDVSEALAVEKLFHETQCPPVLSTKHIHGHTLGACGALETLLAISSLHQDLIPANYGLKNTDPRIRVPVSTGTHSKNINVILKNTLGFGGVNAALVIEKFGGDV